MIKTATTEFFPIVNITGEVIGKASRQECHSGSMLIHPVVHLHIYDSNRNIYLQKRSLNKDIQPGKWDTAVGGHVNYGESIDQALFREAKEELGIASFAPTKLFSYLFESDVEKEIVHSFYTTLSIADITIDNDEISEGRFWTIDEIKNGIGNNIFTPNFEQEFSKLQLLFKW